MIGSSPQMGELNLEMPAPPLNSQCSNQGESARQDYCRFMSTSKASRENRHDSD